MQNKYIKMVDVLIIGAGPAGTLAASLLKQKGRSVQIIEKAIFPRFSIGESLLPRCMDHLQEAGMLEAVKAQGFQQKFGAKFKKDDLACDFDFTDQFTESWKWTWQVPRAEFDQTLATEAEKKGIPILYEHTVTDIQFNDSSSVTTIEDKLGKQTKVAAKFVIDASGFGRVLPRLLQLDTPSDLPPRSSFFTHVIDKSRPEGQEGERIVIIVHDVNTWIWLIPFSNGKTSVGIVANPSFFQEFEGTQEERMRAMIDTVPLAKERLAGLDFDFEPIEITAFAKKTKALYGKGFCLTGNASEFLDPIFSSGVSFAMESGVLSAKLIDRELGGEEVDWESEYVNYLQQGLETFKTYINAWYDGTLQTIFFNPQTNPTIKKQICSVLAGYVWDLSNPYVKKHKRAVKVLSQFLEMAST
ncbi:NAD(P)/FAD-dependent oxidoreductase [Flammeovirgaceae bacterium SG7u.111]|nr:NAD(P)/FAD-dependent oxidoreductase [Flammeovirgaceae bacterium SG7u.132]WPO36110.1 NAD(P)/FAD-dependent oxidoreductase [Flammeovirgaceae bacterium SG7u.111]